MRKLISLLLSITMLFSMTVTIFAADVPNKDYTQTFWDVPKGYWAFNYIAELVDKGVLAGYEDGSFRPDDTVTRAEWAKIMVVGAAINTDVPIHLALENTVDVSKYDWYAPYVVAAREYMNYYIDNDGAYYFKPNTSASREDVTVSMVKLKGYDINKADYSCLGQFTDVNSISNDLKKYVAVAVEKDLISGFEDNTFRGQATLTRAEAATLLWKAFQYGNDNKVVDAPTQQPTTPTQQSDKPVVTPTTKPTPTEAPMTSEPSATPKQTPEPTPEPTATPKPYKIDTIIKANVANVYHYTQDDSNNIYYAENNKIYRVNTQNKEKDEVFNTDSLIIDNDEISLTDFKIESICYDKYENRLLILGNYKSINSINDVNNHYLYAIHNGTFDILTDNFYKHNGNMIDVLSNGDYVLSVNHISQYDVNSGIIIDKDSFEVKQWLNVECAIAEADNKLYYLSGERPNEYLPFTYYFTEYDFVNSTTKWEAGYAICGLAVKNNCVIIANGDVVHMYNFNGKEIGFITSEDYKVIDKTSVNINKFLMKYMITTANDIIVYDTSTKAFRLISENID